MAKCTKNTTTKDAGPNIRVTTTQDEVSIFAFPKATWRKIEKEKNNLGLHHFIYQIHK